jgi:hypothetical protein
VGTTANGTLTMIIGLVLAPGLTVAGASDDPDSPTLAPDPVDFDEVPVGESETITVEITNRSTTESMRIDTIIVAGPFDRDFGDCLGFLGPQESCTMGVGFTPDASGTVTGEVEVIYQFEDFDRVSADIIGTGVEAPPATTTIAPATTTIAPATSTIAPATSTIAPATTSPPATSTIAPDTTSPPATTSSLPTTDDAPTSTTLPLDECRELAKRSEIRPPVDLAGEVGENLRISVAVNLPGAPVPTVSGTGPPPSTSVIVRRLDCEFDATLTAAEEDVAFVSDRTIKGDLRDGNAVLRWLVRPLRPGTLTLTVTLLPLWQGDEIGPEEFEIDVDAKPKSSFESVSDTVGDLTEQPLLRAIPLFAAVVAALAALWRWVLHKPWPWARGLVEGEDDEPPDGGSSGYL